MLVNILHNFSYCDGQYFDYREEGLMSTDTIGAYLKNTISHMQIHRVVYQYLYFIYHRELLKYYLFRKATIFFKTFFFLICNF
jgi:hypothetical protein